MRYRVRSKVAAAGDAINVPDDAKHVKVQHYGGGSMVRVSYLKPVVEVGFSEDGRDGFF